MADTYNGWTNYETWAVNLWMDSEQASAEYWLERARDAFFQAEATGGFTVEEQAAFDLSDALKSEIEEGSPLDEASLYSDLLNAALSEVNWHEIATAWIERVTVNA